MPTRDEAAQEIADLFEHIAIALVSRPLEFDLTWVRSDHSLIITLAPAAPDVGKVLGRGGRLFHAMKDIAQALGGKHRFKIILEVEEPHARQ